MREKGKDKEGEETQEEDEEEEEGGMEQSKEERFDKLAHKKCTYQ